MDPNAYTAPFQLTKSLRRDIYPAIDPKNPELSAASKTVLITGATGGIGGETARAWAEAGAKGIILVGRQEDLLKEPANAIATLSKGTKVLISTADITSESAVEILFDKAKATFGTVDTIVNAAGTMTGGPIGDLDPKTWWLNYEVNVKGAYILAHNFIKAFGGSGTIINLVSMGASFTVPGISAYSGSKLAVCKLDEYLDAEKPNLRVFSVHPGIVATTETKRGMVVDAFTPFAHDKGIQTGGLSLYLSTSKADFLRGGFISVNWDVEELEAHKKEIVDNNLIKLAFLNGKLSPEGHSWTA
ncbi:NAD(P)-binding protein [Viridothelium virens]|uniref:NAD(P)-binding protein n=1 Tax=Viridothelium virens TaxID=1048519 RepID=A0A6A6GS25_VIRVR|nr:NAD(P)-binding protein [Viridothelium virens]